MISSFMPLEKFATFMRKNYTNHQQKSLVVHDFKLNNAVLKLKLSSQ